jgi:hypothetical protein
MIRMPSFAQALVTAAEKELARFGGRHETDTAVQDLLIEYWMAVPGTSKSKALSHIADRTAWSAAFLSFAVRKALTASGSPAVFAFSASHSVYAGAAIRNDFNGVAPPVFLGVPPHGAGGEKPQVGDLIGWSRTTAIDDYEDALKAARHLPKPSTYPSHFDVITKVKDGVATLIGGNVSQTVKQTTVKLSSDGFAPVRGFKFDMAGDIIEGPYICVIRHMG